MSAGPQQPQRNYETTRPVLLIMIPRGGPVPHGDDLEINTFPSISCHPRIDPQSPRILPAGQRLGMLEALLAQPAHHAQRADSVVAQANASTAAQETRMFCTVIERSEVSGARTLPAPPVRRRISNREKG